MKPAHVQIRRLRHEGAWLQFTGAPAMVRAKLTAEVDVDDFPYDVTAIVLVDPVTARPDVESLTIGRRPGGPPVQASLLRKLSPGDIAKAAFNQALMHTYADGADPEDPPREALVREVIRSRRERGKHGDTVRKAAAIYSEATAAGAKSPREAVKNGMFCSDAYAGALIVEARKVGRLPKALPRRTHDEVLQAVADAWQSADDEGPILLPSELARQLGRSSTYAEKLLREADTKGLLTIRPRTTQ